MQALGLPPPPMMVGAQAAPSVAAFGASPFAAAPPMGGSLGGVLSFSNASAVLAQKRAAMTTQLQEEQSLPVISGLSGHIKGVWQKAKQSKLEVEQAMLEALYARRGQYTAEKMAQIVANKQPPIYMMLASSKMRQIDALVRDVLMGTGGEKPWTLSPTPSPTLDPQTVQKIVDGLQQEIQQALMAGLEPTQDQVRERLRGAREELDAKLKEEAVIKCARMENKMEDQLIEGGFDAALDQFISDLSTFKTAFIKGPVVRNKPQLSWSQDGQVQVDMELTLEWERVDPFNMYPAPWARVIGEGPLIEKHQLTREELNQLIGVEGYSEAAIRQVIQQYGTSGLHDWLAIDSQKAVAEGKTQIGALTSTGLIDALQYWGSASGQMLLDWGMDAKQVTDPEKEYQIEAWLIGTYVIKAVLNSDPLARRPYYAYSFQPVPGNVWGNSPYDLMSDCQDMCNAAARSLAANLGISSGPQVAIISNRLPAGEDVTDMYPWKIWQFETDPMGSTAKPIEFFQPSSNATELLGVFDRFSQLADEYTGIPRYMAGFNEGAGGAGRTASGMSMMIGNASKIIKQVLAGIDNNIFTPLLGRQYYYNMRYSDDPELKGDVRVVARGAISMQIRDAAAQRRNEFLMATNNPTDMQIIGLDGRAEVLRAAAQTLDLNTDRVVPAVAVLKERQAEAAKQQAAMQQAALQQAQGQAMQANQPPEGAGAQGGPPIVANAPGGPTPGHPGSPTALRNMPGRPMNRQALMNGRPVTDHFSPAPQGR